MAEGEGDGGFFGLAVARTALVGFRPEYVVLGLTLGGLLTQVNMDTPSELETCYVGTGNKVHPGVVLRVKDYVVGRGGREADVSTGSGGDVLAVFCSIDDIPGAVIDHEDAHGFALYPAITAGGRSTGLRHSCHRGCGRCLAYSRREIHGCAAAVVRRKTIVL